LHALESHHRVRVRARSLFLRVCVCAGWFFWNFKTELEPKWSYLESVRRGWMPQDAQGAHQEVADACKVSAAAARRGSSAALRQPQPCRFHTRTRYATQHTLVTAVSASFPPCPALPYPACLPACLPSVRSDALRPFSELSPPRPSRPRTRARSRASRGRTRARTTSSRPSSGPAATRSRRSPNASRPPTTTPACCRTRLKSSTPRGTSSA
jgi:hypothetical protein